MDEDKDRLVFLISALLDELKDARTAANYKQCYCKDNVRRNKCWACQAKEITARNGY